MLACSNEVEYSSLFPTQWTWNPPGHQGICPKTVSGQQKQNYTNSGQPKKPQYIELDSTQLIKARKRKKKGVGGVTFIHFIIYPTYLLERWTETLWFNSSYRFNCMPHYLWKWTHWQRAPKSYSTVTLSWAQGPQIVQYRHTVLSSATNRIVPSLAQGPQIIQYRHIFWPSASTLGLFLEGPWHTS